MRLKISRVSAEELILQQLNCGYRLAQEIYNRYVQEKSTGAFDKDTALPNYHHMLNGWIDETRQTLASIFPTDLEAHFFYQRFSIQDSTYLNMDSTVGALVFARIPTYVERLHKILDSHLQRYSNLPLQERLFIEDVDSFMKVRDVNPSMVSHCLKNGRIELTEDEMQMALETILNVPFHKKDWGGEINDLYTANLVLNGARRSTAFLLKGNGLKKNEMTIADCGKNGDQIVRLFQSPAELFVVQYVGLITEAVIHDLHTKTTARRAQGTNANYLVIDGQDTARLLYAYNKLPK